MSEGGRLTVILAATVTLGAALRFSTLGVQSYHHDEIITVARVLPGGFIHMLRRVRESESNPPLYYVAAWTWAKAFGTGEVGLRSLSALIGTATIPVAFLAGRAALDDRAGLVAAALAAVNPMLIWYSQEARSYALLVFFSALSLYFFLRALRSGGHSGLIGWALASAAALCSHYFTGFAVAIEAVWLLVALSERRRAAVLAVATTAVVGAALVPLLLFQVNGTHIGWIASMPLPDRLLETGVSFLAGETGHVIAQPARPGYAIVPAVFVALATLLLLRSGSAEERRRALPPLVVGFGAIAAATIVAAVGKDYLIERNLLAALLPLILVLAIGLTVPHLGRAGPALAAALCAYWIVFAVYVALTPNLQRPDFRGVAEAIGPPRTQRAVVGWELGATAIRHYLPDRSERVFGRIAVGEIDVEAKPNVRNLGRSMPPGFHRVSRQLVGRIAVSRFLAARPRVVPYYLLSRLPTGYGSNGVVADGLSRKGSD
ncbi:MAG TPA: glycosyltransferase family 39 protein [Solirubrobacterales bacterium]|nr:glycosyltransferase family 39 protein [Solirubrobacterales bacterium]